jgi:hypothetical protein
MRMNLPLTLPAVLAMAAVPAAAPAANVSLAGIVLNTCLLTVTTPGVLAAGASGTRLSSEELGGLPAILAVISTGTMPTLNFSAPGLTGPSGWNGSPVVSIRYHSANGVTQAYTSDASSARAGALLDTFTINAQATNSSGFLTGTYTVASTVTCQQ